MDESAEVVIPEGIVLRSRDEFKVYQHRGYGRPALSHYVKDQWESDRFNVNNTVTGLELAVLGGADAIEVDLIRTKDGKYVLKHPASPMQKSLDMNSDEFFKQNPESMTFTELLDWMGHQDKRLNIFLELKSQIDFSEITRAVKEADPDGSRDILKRLMLYGSDNAQIEGFLQEKKKAGLGTEELKLWQLTNGLVNRGMVDKVAAMGEEGNRIYGVEQGMMPWGTNALVDRLPTFLGGIGGSFKDLVDYTHSRGLKIITGTVDKPKMINWLMQQNVDGVVPNNAMDFKTAGLRRPRNETPILPATEQDKPQTRYLPETVKSRLDALENKVGELFFHPEHDLRIEKQRPN